MQSLNLTQHYVEPSTTPQPYQGHWNRWRLALVIWSTAHTNPQVHAHAPTYKPTSVRTHTHTVMSFGCNHVVMFDSLSLLSSIWFISCGQTYICLWLHYFVYLNISKLQSWNHKCHILVPRFLLSDLYMQIIIITPFYIYISH